MKLFMSFVKATDGSVSVGLGETTDDRFGHGDGISSADDVREFAEAECLNLPCVAGVLWSIVKLALDNGASMVEYVVDAPWDEESVLS